jgi:peptidoglycan/xylan/chitin deacetylase (PgdA/CDA1 family)
MSKKKSQSKKPVPVQHVRPAFVGSLIVALAFFFCYTFVVQRVAIEPVVTATPTPSPTPTLKPAARPEIQRVDSSKKQAVFTFDAGEGVGSTEEILAALKKHNIRGTFFLVGKWVEKNPELTRRLVAEGHEIFNHSYSHPYFTQLTQQEIADELQKMDDVLFATAGVRTKPYYRAPYGDRDSATNDAAFAAGYQHIYWSVDSLDWRPEDTPETVKRRTLSNMHPGAIVLMHVGNDSTGPVIDEIFTTLKEQGYTLLSLTEAL